MDKFHQPVNTQPPGTRRNCKADEVGLVIIVPLRKILLNTADELKNDKEIVLVVDFLLFEKTIICIIQNKMKDKEADTGKF